MLFNVILKVQKHILISIYIIVYIYINILMINNNYINYLNPHSYNLLSYFEIDFIRLHSTYEQQPYYYIILYLTT